MRFSCTSLHFYIFLLLLTTYYDTLRREVNTSSHTFMFMEICYLFANISLFDKICVAISKEISLAAKINLSSSLMIIIIVHQIKIFFIS